MYRTVVVAKLTYMRQLLVGLIEEADENLRNNIRYNPSHILHHLLPRRTESSYSLRSRPHNLYIQYVNVGHKIAS